MTKITKNGQKWPKIDDFATTRLEGGPGVKNRRFGIQTFWANGSRLNGRRGSILTI